MEVKGLEDTPASGSTESTLAFEPEASCDFQVELSCGAVQRAFTRIVDSQSDRVEKELTPASHQPRDPGWLHHPCRDGVQPQTITCQGFTVPK